MSYYPPNPIRVEVRCGLERVVTVCLLIRIDGTLYVPCRWPAFTASLTFELFRRNPDFDPSSMSVPHPTTTTSTSLHPDATPHNGTSILVDHEEDHVDPMQPPQNQGVLQSVLGSARFGRRMGVDREKRGEGEYCAFIFFQILCHSYPLSIPLSNRNHFSLLIFILDLHATRHTFSCVCAHIPVPLPTPEQSYARAIRTEI